MKKNTTQAKNLEIPPATPVKIAIPQNTDNTPFMPNKTLILIGILALITIILVGLALFTGLPKTNTPVQKPVVKVLKTTLAVLKPVATAKGFTSDITLTTERKKITAVQIELSYDPKAIANVDIKPGSYFPNPVVLSKKIDKANGTVSYVLGIGLSDSPINGNGQVAILNFTPLVKVDTTTIALLPQSKTTASGSVPSILTNVQGIQFSFGPIPTK